MSLTRITGILTLLLLAALPLKGQDIHFSQIDTDPMLFNPAYTGFSDATARFGLIYRNQWATVSDAFQTMAATAEVSLLRRRYWRDGLSLGFIFAADRAGTLHYGTTAANVILAYYKSLNPSNNHFISVAAEGSVGQSGYLTDEIDFEDPAEQMALTSLRFLTFGVGAAWFYQPTDDLYFKVGVAARNLNEPDLTYLGLGDSRLFRKYTFYSRAEYRFNPVWSVLPLAAVQLQRQYSEARFGCDAKWYYSETSDRQISFGGGIHYRWRDAALVQLFAEYNAFLFALHYDANFSKLTPASRSIGSFEVCMVYRLVKNQRVRRRAIPCPIM